MTRAAAEHHLRAARTLIATALDHVRDRPEHGDEYASLNRSRQALAEVRAAIDALEADE